MVLQQVHLNDLMCQNCTLLQLLGRICLRLRVQLEWFSSRRIIRTSFNTMIEEERKFSQNANKHSNVRLNLWLRQWQSSLDDEMLQRQLEQAERDVQLTFQRLVRARHQDPPAHASSWTLAFGQCLGVQQQQVGKRRGVVHGLMQQLAQVQSRGILFSNTSDVYAPQIEQQQYWESRRSDFLRQTKREKVVVDNNNEQHQVPLILESRPYVKKDDHRRLKKPRALMPQHTRSSLRKQKQPYKSRKLPSKSCLPDDHHDHHHRNNIPKVTTQDMLDVPLPMPPPPQPYRRMRTRSLSSLAEFNEELQKPSEDLLLSEQVRLQLQLEEKNQLIRDLDQVNAQLRGRVRAVETQHQSLLDENEQLQEKETQEETHPPRSLFHQRWRFGRWKRTIYDTQRQATVFDQWHNHVKLKQLCAVAQLGRQNQLVCRCFRQWSSLSHEQHHSRKQILRNDGRESFAQTRHRTQIQTCRALARCWAHWRESRYQRQRHFATASSRLESRLGVNEPHSLRIWQTNVQTRVRRRLTRVFYHWRLVHEHERMQRRALTECHELHERWTETHVHAQQVLIDDLECREAQMQELRQHYEALLETLGPVVVQHSRPSSERMSSSKLQMLWKDFPHLNRYIEKHDDDRLLRDKSKKKDVEERENQVPEPPNVDASSSSSRVNQHSMMIHPPKTRTTTNLSDREALAVDQLRQDLKYLQAQLQHQLDVSSKKQHILTVDSKTKKKTRALKVSVQKKPLLS